MAAPAPLLRILLPGARPARNAQDSHGPLSFAALDEGGSDEDKSNDEEEKKDTDKGEDDGDEDGNGDGDGDWDVEFVARATAFVTQTAEGRAAWVARLSDDARHESIREAACCIFLDHVQRTAQPASALAATTDAEPSGVAPGGETAEAAAAEAEAKVAEVAEAGLSMGAWGACNAPLRKRLRLLPGLSLSPSLSPRPLRALFACTRSNTWGDDTEPWNADADLGTSMLMRAQRRIDFLREDVSGAFSIVASSGASRGAIPVA